MISNSERAVKAFPVLFEPDDWIGLGRQGSGVGLPCRCGYEPGFGVLSMAQEIMHLNDNHNPTDTYTLDPWPRERIADWLDQIHETGVMDLTVTWGEA